MAHSAKRSAVCARVRVQPLRLAEAGELSRLLAESAEFHQGWVSYPTVPEQVTAFVAQAGTTEMLIFAVRRVADGDLVGIMTLCRIAREPWQTAEYGCAVGVRHRGHGYLTEATALLVRHAVKELGLHRIEALVQPENRASARMLTAAGFQMEGMARGAIRVRDTWADHLRWAITAEDINTK